MIDCHLSPIASRYQPIQCVEYSPPRVESECNHRFKFMVIDDGEHHDAQHESVSHSADTDRDNDPSEPCKHLLPPSSQSFSTHAGAARSLALSRGYSIHSTWVLRGSVEWVGFVPTQKNAPSASTIRRNEVSVSPRGLIARTLRLHGP